MDESIDMENSNENNIEILNDQQLINKDSNVDEDASPIDSTNLPNEKLLKLPFIRIKNIAKMDNEVNLINQEATFLIAKATELFIESIATESSKYTLKSKKRIIQKRDLDQAIDDIDALAFLEGML